MDKQEAKALSHEIWLAAADIAKRHGLSLRKSRGKFTDATYRASFELFGLTPDGDTSEAADYKQLAKSYQLDPNWLGKSFGLNGNRFKVIGLMPKSHVRPVLVEKDGKRYKATAKMVQDGFAAK